MFKKYSLKKQFISTFVLVLACSMISVLVTVIIGLSLINGKSIKPANYYENMIPKIESYIKSDNIKLLDKDYKNKLDELIPSKGIKYKVIDLDSTISYGTLEKNLDNKKEIIDRLNTSYVDKKNNVDKYIPIISEDYYLKGAVILNYTLGVSSDNIPQSIISLVSITILVSPFIYIMLFSYLFGRKLAININEPLDKLKWASSKIKGNDLDFDLEYPYNNELGEVITSFDEMKKELKNTLNKQWSMEEERKEIISGLSHDLRSPLTVIKGKVDMLLEGSYKNETRLITYLESINKSTDRAVMLVEDLNTINKLENSKVYISPSDNNIVNFLNEKLEGFRALAHEKAISINLVLADIYNEVVWRFDEAAISRVLDNIITNAIRYTDNNGNIDINIYIKENRLYFKISDTGRGFSDNDLKFALNKFYRGDKARGVGSGNSGLGLYICKVVIEKHNGKIMISNNKNKGANVEFYIKILELKV